MDPEVKERCDHLMRQAEIAGRNQKP